MNTVANKLDIATNDRVVKAETNKYDHIFILLKNKDKSITANPYRVIRG